MRELRKSLRDVAAMVDLNKEYPGLPKKLEPFSVYILDSGFCIMSIPEMFREPAKDDPDAYEVGVPTKYVLTHPYSIEKGYVLIDVPYDEKFGISVDGAYWEY